jgi:hypothetical protein
MDAPKIIPFPRVRPSAETAAATAPDVAAVPEVPDATRQRLDRALSRLQTALAEQHAAALRLRDVAGTLKQSMDTLGDSMQQYHDRLDALRSGVAGLNRQAGDMARWADGVLAGSDTLPG